MTATSGDPQLPQLLKCPIQINGTDAPKILLFECDWDVGIGGSVWTSAELLTAYLQSQQSKLASSFNGKCIVELGSGTGYVGLAAATCFTPSVTYLTDLKSHLDCLHRNVERNKDTFNGQSDSLVKVKEFDWSETEHQTALLQDVKDTGRNQVDVILGTDVAYLEELHEPLLTTLDALASESSLILLGFNRVDTDWRFFQRLQDFEFVYYKVPDRLLPFEFQGKDFALFEIRRQKSFAKLPNA